ncbi:MurR/RpiR family transcriptional regulator [Staphylococcus simiae]|uniref:MurR/RpiR family transcriptional regulator n=1 Tax=Staphylococcus simiae TaxID=308354 RepID=UPI001A95EF26|nr:MurR/RpiR family transcriptional regulator [Staphylococcus simiae]MBO1199968.1 MurR/RpiR family transcriptional regulator [Staphylococcus simiae]MBO1201964.1 MurR/RpiR family transcriptional regulator [Staphylococcus simiae]MBO1204157.1 MurR/RpiR family transcriptional regulator [Staphylococcus simiae]MBO1212040.1 MurR/RpiR family transcriptional regulator [Staphylococcus simiae]MBO1230413.1 MurR/RpiR family transcriptional regulator [Staphylococcus simiae]
MSNVLTKIDHQYPYMTQNEKKIAQFILNCPQKVIHMRSQDLAKKLDISASSVIRFSKKITDSGFNDLKLSISKYVPKASSLYNVELVHNESTSSLRNKLHSRTVKTLGYANDEINDDIVDDICHYLKHSNTIFIYGFGSSFVAATDMYQKLSRVGLNKQLVQESHIFATLLATHNSNDCVILITNNGMQNELQSMVKVIVDYHIPIVTITSTKDNPVALASNIVLTYGKTNDNETHMSGTTSLFAQLFTIDVIYYRYVALNYHASLDFITQSKMALDNYRKHLSNLKFKH